MVALAQRWLGELRRWVRQAGRWRASGGASRGTTARSTAASGVTSRRPFLEVQYHPTNIRKGVRYLFLTRRQVGWILLGSATYLAFVGFSLSLHASRNFGRACALRRRERNTYRRESLPSRRC